MTPRRLVDGAQVASSDESFDAQVDASAKQVIETALTISGRDVERAALALKMG